MNMIKHLIPSQMLRKAIKHQHWFIDSEKKYSNSIESMPVKLVSKQSLSIRYVTTRKTGELPADWFSCERDYAVDFHYGEISLPEYAAILEEDEHAEIGNLFSTTTTRDDLVSQATHKVLSESDYHRDIENLEGDTLVYIHGYNKDFTSAVNSVMRLAYSARFSGQIYLFSWPSHEKFMKYSDDKKIAVNSSPILTTLLTDLLSNKTGRVHLLAHSMGNLALVTALQSLQNNSDSHFENIILVAPDLAAKRFTEKRWPQIKHLAKHWSLYFSNKDLALMLSRIMNVKSRLGASACSIDGLECIDVSNTFFKRCSWSESHNYHELRSKVSQDIISRISGLTPRQRSLVPVKQSETVWKFS